MTGRIMYIEEKPGLAGQGRIGRVTFSKTGRTIYYRGRAFRSLKGQGFKANYYDIETDERYWISGPRNDGRDPLYPAVVEIDDDVRVEYWKAIRDRPDQIHVTSYRSLGKYTKRGTV
jgi:hypothetical protein